MTRRKISVFEYDDILVGENGLRISDLAAIAHYEDSTRRGVFRVGWNRIRTQGQVGVFVSGDLVIEILPKVERRTTGNGPQVRDKWSAALKQMVATVFDIPVIDAGWVHRDTREDTILDVIAHHFVVDCEQLFHRGLAKGYRRSRETFNGVRGKCLTAKMTPRSVVHPELVTCEYDAYDNSILHNRLLALGLKSVASLPISLVTAERARKLSEVFPAPHASEVTEETFRKLVYDRRTEHYRRALSVCELVILGRGPTSTAGRVETLAVLFDMPILFEKYVSALVRRAGRLSEWTVELQQRRAFWKQRQIRPDIVATKHGQTVVIDTKWKVLESPTPSDDDLKQMYVYSRFFDATVSLLIYPDVYAFDDSTFPYQYPDTDVTCGLVFVRLFDGQHLSVNIGSAILQKVDRILERLAVPTAGVN
ncbi:MAG: hypothetical protein WD492_16410 [Alkalispirochaeta sp.]